VRDKDPIGYLVPEFPSQTHTFFWRELGALEAAGVPVHVFSTRRPPDAACPHAFGPEARARTTYLFPPRWGRVLGFLARHPLRFARAAGYVLGLRETPLPHRLKLLALVASAADLVLHAREKGVAHVHIHSCANAAHLGALAHVLGGLDYSLTLHGDLPVYGTDHKAKMARARFVSAVTAPLQRSLQEEVGHDQPYPVIWMGVDTARFAPDPARRGTGGPFRAVSVARLTHVKGHRFFLRAMARLCAEGHDIRYQMAGEGPERAEIAAEIARLGLEEHAILLGSVGEDRVLELLQGAHTLALTSIRKGEAAPVAVMEAMSCGVPPIVSIIGGTADMVEHGVDGFLTPQEDVDAITEALRTLVTDPDRRAAMGAAARATALEKFDHRTNALALLEVIRKTMR
jgi:colanic acid/amylovoran biosynthesis glycosyltransferase